MANGNFLKNSALLDKQPLSSFLVTNMENVNLEKNKFGKCQRLALCHASECFVSQQLLHWGLLCKYPSIKFVEDFLISRSNDPLLPLHQMHRVVINDFMNSAGEKNRKTPDRIECNTGLLASCALYRIRFVSLLACLLFLCFSGQEGPSHHSA